MAGFCGELSSGFAEDCLFAVSPYGTEREGGGGKRERGRDTG